MLDWSKIDNDKIFQILVDDLIWLELDKPGFVAGSPYSGRDKGWDGRFDGDYKGIKGSWSIQAK